MSLYLFALVLIFNSNYSFAQNEVYKLEELEVHDYTGSNKLVDFLPSILKIQDKELQNKRQTSLGDMLKGEAGINSTTFGPSASRPVIRGLDGDRVRVLQNSLGTLDASTQSVDHAIPLDMLTVKSVEVIRGPVSLLYGSSAVGGVVNVVTNRIATDFEKGFNSSLLSQAETNNNGLSNAAQFNFGKNNWMYHGDASTRNLMDQKVNGYAQKEEPKSHRGKVNNSFNKQNAAGFGASKIFEKGYLGFSFNHFNSNYGIVLEEDVTIGMIQNRLESHGEYKLNNPVFSKLKFKGAIADYQHKEFLLDETETTFKNKGHELRLEAINSKSPLHGVVGLHTNYFHMSADGDEAFLPESKNQKSAIFTYQEIHKKKNTYSFGARVENSGITKVASTQFGGSKIKNVTGLSGSLGHQYKFNSENSLSTSYSYTERAPNFQELFADGEHVALGIVEVGDSGLDKEKANALEVNYKSKTNKNEANASVYTQVFHDYIALTPTAGGDNVYENVEALFYGIDLDNKLEIHQSEMGLFYFVSKYDFVRAKNTKNGSNLPRISPQRLSLGLEFQKNKLKADIEAQYIAHQTKKAEDETKTDSATLTNLGLSYDIMSESAGATLFARARNIFDVKARNHVSTLKDISPLPGRNFIIGVQAQF
jgi:iron complex outermembrane receptor protein